MLDMGMIMATAAAVLLLRGATRPSRGLHGGTWLSPGELLTSEASPNRAKGRSDSQTLAGELGRLSQEERWEQGVVGPLA